MAPCWHARPVRGLCWRMNAPDPRADRRARPIARPIAIALLAAASTASVPALFASPASAPSSTEPAWRALELPCAGATLAAEPARPRQGSLFRVRLAGADADAALRGTVAGEPLHFAAAAGAHEALAAAPIDAASPATPARSAGWRADMDAALSARGAARARPPRARRAPRRDRRLRPRRR